jgi:hypothetical protein
MTTRMRTKHYLQHEEGEFELSCENVSQGDEIVRVGDGMNVAEGRAWVGYLTGDDDMEFPFDDGWYTIVGRGKYRHGGKDHADDERTFQEALALNHEWEPATEEYEEQAHLDVVLAGLQSRTKRGKVELDWFDQAGGEGEIWLHYENGWGKSEGAVKLHLPFKAHWSRAAKYVEGKLKEDVWCYHLTFRGITVEIGNPHDRMMEIWQAKKDAGEIGNPYAVLLDVYDHSGVAWSIRGGGMNDGWDTSSGAGIWIPSPDCIKQIEEQWLKPEARWNEAVRMARGACETYTDYVNGWGYASVVEEYQRATEEDDWEQVDYDVRGGLLGHTYAVEALKEHFDEQAETL